ILLADGSVRTIEDVFRLRRGRLLTLTDQWRFVATEPSAFIYDGVKPVFDLTTRLGRRGRRARPPPVLTIDGWKPLSDVRPGDHIAVPRCMPVFGTARLGEERVKLLGYLIGDGAISQGCPSFINNDPRLVADFQDAIARFGGVSVRERA